MNDILEVISDICMSELFVDCDITYDTNLKEIFDELDIVDLSMSLEEEFDIEFSKEEYESINNVGELIELIQNKK